VNDLPAAVRFYVDVIGFRRAGGRVLWGPGLSIVQGLGDDAAATVWWALGGQDFVQLEFFQHTLPVGRRRTLTWRPCDLGWTRVGIEVANLDETLARAHREGHDPIGAIMDDREFRRAALHDPDGVVVELIEPVTRERETVRPTVCYAALSVVDLDPARRFWIDTCGLTEIDPATLHRPEHEALWGLDDARREVIVVRGQQVALEIARYHEPLGAARPPDYRLCDQGLLNVALAYREREFFDALLDRVLARGYRSMVECPPGPFASTYLVDDQGCSVEIFSCPRDHDALLGFEVEPGFAPGFPLDP
jgi:catechol 2,3-dioxygenase-like lactoylglutathione lyase family enzyme